MESGIYKIVNPTGRIYVGQSVNIEVRFKSYRSGNSKTKSQIKLFRSFEKYGVELHEFSILELCGIGKLNERERYWQEHYNVLDGGLNCYLTECADKRRIMSEETKQKISISKIGQTHTNETKNKIALASMGKQYSLGRKRTIEERERISKTMKSRGINIADKNPRWGKIGIGAKPVKHIETGEIFESLKQACTVLGIKYTKGRKHLSGQNKNTTGLAYV